jgi:hypothetical protein
MRFGVGGNQHQAVELDEVERALANGQLEHMKMSSIRSRPVGVMIDTVLL